VDCIAARGVHIVGKNLLDVNQRALARAIAPVLDGGDRNGLDVDGRCAFRRTLFHAVQKIVKRDFCIAQRAFQGEAMDFFVKRENDPTPIGMLHFHVAALAVRLDEAQALQSRHNLSARQQWRLHNVSATIS